MSALPTRTNMSDPNPTPNNAQARAWHLAVWDAFNGLFGPTGVPADARNAFGVSSTAEMTAAIAAAVPAGATMPFARNTAPTGWLKANGALVSRTTYAALFAAIGTTFGVGDGSTTFALPDLRGEFIRGWDDGRGIDSGRAFGSAQADDLKSHNHGFSQILYTPGANGTTGPSGGTVYYSGVTGGAETRPRNIAQLVCIKF